jgi:hypothetical protein
MAVSRFIIIIIIIIVIFVIINSTSLCRYDIARSTSVCTHVNHYNGAHVNDMCLVYRIPSLVKIAVDDPTTLSLLNVQRCRHIYHPKQATSPSFITYRPKAEYCSAKRRLLPIVAIIIKWATTTQGTRPIINILNHN